MHPGIGTHNAMWMTGDSYVELLAVHDPIEAAGGWSPVWPQVRALLRRGGGTFRFRVAVPSLTAETDRLAALGIRARTLEGTTRYDADTRHWSHVIVPGSPSWGPVFTEDRARGLPPPAWRIGALVVDTPDPAAAGAWLARVVGSSCTAAPLGLVVAIGDVSVVFRVGADDSITTVLVAGAGAPRGDVANLRFEPLAA